MVIMCTRHVVCASFVFVYMFYQYTKVFRKGSLACTRSVKSFKISFNDNVLLLLLSTLLVCFIMYCTSILKERLKKLINFVCYKSTIINIFIVSNTTECVY